jgi:hypothetical protein
MTGLIEILGVIGVESMIRQRGRQILAGRKPPASRPPG